MVTRCVGEGDATIKLVLHGHQVCWATIKLMLVTRCVGEGDATIKLVLHGHQVCW